MLILDKVKTDLVLAQTEDVKVPCSGELSLCRALEMMKTKFASFLYFLQSCFH